MTFEEAADRKWQVIRAILLERRYRYGTENIKEGGFSGVILRLCDKLVKLRGDFNACKIICLQDHLIDLAGYAILGMMLQDGEIDYPQQAPNPGGGVPSS